MDSIDAKGTAPKSDEATNQLSPSLAASGGNIPDTENFRYKMNNIKRGCAVIINNKDFNKETNLEERKGTDLDADSMNDLLKTLGFENIKTLKNQTAKEMKVCLKTASQVDYTDMDCFVCVVLTHGEEGFVWGIDDKVAIERLVLPFKGDNCPSLAGKPKIFFIQACRGLKFDEGMDVTDAVGSSYGMKKSNAVYRIPVEADFLMAYSTVPGFFSWRRVKSGSWFIQAVVDVLTNNWRQMDLLSMMTRVNKKVAYEFESHTLEESTDNKKQIPCITSMLTKDVYF